MVLNIGPGAGQATQDVEGQHKFDEQSLARYLKARLPGYKGELTVKKFGYGQSNPTYMLSTSAGQKYVLRKRPPGKLIKGAHAIDREHRVMAALGKVGFEVPKMQLYCEDDSVIGTHFYVMDFVKGPIVDNALSNAPPEQRRPILLGIVRTLAKLHKYNPALLGLVTKDKPFGRVGGFYPRQLTSMEKLSTTQVSGSEGKIRPIARFEELLSVLRHRLPPDASCVVHGDFKPDNVILVEGDPSRVAAVIDWELSTIGHPMSDLANMCLSYVMPPGNPVGYPAFDLSPGSGVPTLEEVHRTYCEAAGRPFPIAGWDFFMAFACLRLAVIIQGVAMRASKGQASAFNNQTAGDVVGGMMRGSDFLVERGLQLMGPQDQKHDHKHEHKGKHGEAKGTTDGKPKSRL